MTQTHAVIKGQVFCAVQHKAVDVVSCYGCEKVIEIDLDSRQPKVTCEVADRDEPSVAS
jgi:hypothetical protein